MDSSHSPRAHHRCVEDLEGRLLLSTLAESPPGTPPPLSAEIGRQHDTNGDGLVLTSRASIAGTTSPGATVRLDRKGDGSSERSARADTSGRFTFPVGLAIGRTRFLVHARDAGGANTSVEVTATRCDAVIAWNTTALNAIRTDGTAPPQASRALAMAQLAVYDAVNAVSGHRTPYHYSGKARPGTSASAAASEAAYRVLASLYPRQVATFDAALRESLATVPTGRGLRLGTRLGAAVGADMVALRANDGSAVPKVYAPGTAPGDWVPTPPRNLPGLAPQWSSVTPFAMASGSQFRPSPPPAITSPEYAAALDEVREFGSASSTRRTADQTALAAFWSDVPGSTFTPPGHWNQIAQGASFKEKLGLVRNARLFAVLDAALADAGISSWDAKYFYNLWRPLTAIREADRDGNPGTSADAKWTPLWVTPNFPSYTSGHSTFSGAAQTVLETFFGDDFAFTDGGDPTLNLPARHFEGFAQAAKEAGYSRVLGGIHFAFDNVEGLNSGRRIGRYVSFHIAH